MRVIFVRHGHPNYEIDCLTELGHLQAEAAAERLCGEGIEEIHASSSGRAAQTAEHIGAKLGLPCKTYDFMRELNWGSANDEEIPLNGQPWKIAFAMASDGERVMNPEWREHHYFQNNLLLESVPRVANGFDSWLAELGYVREGDYYRVKEKNSKTVVMASHAGASSAALSHIFNLPFPFVCKAIQPKYTAITIISFNGEEGDLISPMVEIMNDARHIAGIETQNVFGK
jgi:probable phosphoglycerate mutase